MTSGDEVTYKHLVIERMGYVTLVRLNRTAA
ncbi:MAG: hypothetical protein ACJATP_003406, partial [Candidatus Azotimanducaceae bacterium]